MHDHDELMRLADDLLRIETASYDDENRLVGLVTELRQIAQGAKTGGVVAPGRDDKTWWMLEAVAALDSAGHGLLAAAMATLAEGVRTGRVINAPPPAAQQSD